MGRKVIFIDICTLGYNKINKKGALETPGPSQNIIWLG
jgi:hypothetical protein